MSVQETNKIPPPTQVADHSPLVFENSDDEAVSAATTTALNPSLLKLKLLDCLRNSDEEKLTELVNSCRSAAPYDPQISRLLRQLLLFATQVGPLSIVEFIVKNNLVDDLNAQDEDGNTALHLAAMSSRNELITYLMSQEDINDCIVNKESKQPIECSSDIATAQLLSDLRTKFVEVKANELRNAFEARKFDILENLLSNPRTKTLLDINGTDPVTGDTVLLEFIKKDDAEMVKFILKHGGDPFKRNLNGKLPIDSSVSSSMKKLIKESCNNQTMIDSTGQPGSLNSGPPTFKGFLKKWTNFASGYKLRWFILDAEGRLSYYKSPNDIYNTCRGMIHLASAQLKMDSSEKSKFEIIIKNGSDENALRWHLKANHVIETNRWVWALQNAIRYAKDLERQQKGQAIEGNQRKPKKVARNAESFETTRSTSTQNIGNRQNSLTEPPPIAPHQRTLSASSTVSVPSEEDASPVSNQVSENSGSSTRSLYRKPMRKLTKFTKRTKEAFSLPEIKENSDLKLPRSPVPSGASAAASNLSLPSTYDPSFNNTNHATASSSLDDELESLDDDEEEDATVPNDTKDDSFLDGEDYQLPDLNNSDLTVSKNQMKIELRSFGEFLRAAEEDSSTTKAEVVEVSLNVLKNLTALSTRQSQLITKYEGKFTRLIGRQHEISRIWENSLKRLELEMQGREAKIVELEDKLRVIKKSLRSNPNLVRAVAEASGTATPSAIQQRAQFEAVAGNDLNEAPKAEGESPSEITNQIMQLLEEDDDSDDEFFDAEDEGAESAAEAPVTKETEEIAPGQKQEQNLHEQEQESIAQKQPEEATIVTAGTGAASARDFAAQREPSQMSESNTLAEEPTPRNQVKEEPVLEKPMSGPAPVVNGFQLKSQKQVERYQLIQKEATFHGYEDPIRTTLAKEDNRPKISLWGVLKSLVGKDMTKMTLPVTFNEPTSLLQRNTEVIEYSDLLDKAATIDDSTLRLVYIAAFAASEYVSTVGRIAKPFNPLLGETFEYARPDKGYRVLVEQVSHHPPISALVAQAPAWSYYGESNVETKFLGRSFDIKHLGTWFCELYPDNGVIDQQGQRRDHELYSWKKVRNSVVGIIVGNPTIDNYGEMEIRNHITGDYMNFNFKPRGWRASSAGEVKGEVFSRDGKLRYTVGGHWNSKLYAKDATNPSAAKFLIWEANERQEMMFHLTSFAASLNAPQPHLLPVVACTDTRLRPDQRAMEEGKYDLASEEKERVENKQRQAKRERDAKNEEYHPSFFHLDKHSVTGDRIWKYDDKYWELRKEGKLKDYNSIF